MDGPTASIVVVTSDRTEDLRRCLATLREHLDPRLNPRTEVLTVHPPHDVTSMRMVRAEFPAVRVLTAAERHIGKQRNLGARDARGDVVVYLDDDAWPRGGWLRELLAAFDDPAVVAASGPVFRGDGSLQNERLAASAIGRLVPVHEGQPLARGMSPSFSGCNLAIRRRALFACGGFDENLPYQPDDMDVCRRLFLCAGRDERAFRFCERAAVTHESSPGPYRRTLKDRAWYVVARDNVYFACRHAGPLRGVLGGVLLQLPKLARFFRWFLAGQLGAQALARCVAKHVAGTLAGAAKGLTHRAALPLTPLPETAPNRAATPVREESACPTQPV